VIQALSCVRQAARHRKKERFTALLHHLNVDTLRTAFLALKRKAAPGVQGLKILPSSGRRKQVTDRISTQHRDFAGCEIVIGGDDLELVFLDLLGEDR
jgi:hypothetical protein